MREVTTEGLRLLNQGAEGAVYQYSQDKVLKIYFHKTEEEIALNRKRMQSFQEAGIPVVPMYETVRCNNQFGMICEFVKGSDLSVCIAKNPEKIEEYAAGFTELLAKINQTKMEEGILPRKVDTYIKLLRVHKSRMTGEEFALLMDFMEAIPDVRTCVQGDPHLRNFMFLQNRLVCVDLDAVGYGHPVLDVSKFFLYSMLLTRKSPAAVKLLGMDAECGEKIWNYFVKAYFQERDDEEIEKIGRNIKVYAYLSWLVLLAVPGLGTEEKITVGMQAARKYAFPYLRELMGKDPLM